LDPSRAGSMTEGWSTTEQPVLFSGRKAAGNSIIAMIHCRISQSKFTAVNSGTVQDEAPGYSSRPSYCSRTIPGYTGIHRACWTERSPAIMFLTPLACCTAAQWLRCPASTWTTLAASTLWCSTCSPVASRGSDQIRYWTHQTFPSLRTYRTFPRHRNSLARQ
jgi:hypothetical protein